DNRRFRRGAAPTTRFEMAADSSADTPLLFHAPIHPGTLSARRPGSRSLQHRHRASAFGLRISITGKPAWSITDWPGRIFGPPPDSARHFELEFPTQPGRHA